MRRTHPNLYRLVMLIGATDVLLGLNFLLLSPTFLIFDMPNPLWAACFAILGVSQLMFLNVARSLRIVRATMAISGAFHAIIAIGTSQPAAEGEGSLQLPFLYLAVAGTLYLLLREPYINPQTRKTP